MDDEMWKPVVGLERFYEVSDLGRVRSLPREKSNSRATYMTKLRLMSAGVNRNGYHHLVLVGENKTKIYARVHQLVAEAFIGPRNGLDTDHINGDKDDNSLLNLQYITRRENTNKGRVSKLKDGKLHNSVGTQYDKRGGKWRASAYINGKTRHLGQFNTEQEAAKAYLNATA